MFGDKNAFNVIKISIWFEWDIFNQYAKGGQLTFDSNVLL
jgi:hypothetical protein